MALPVSPSNGRDSPLIFAPNTESEEWLQQWRSILAKDLVDGPLVDIDADVSVEDACEHLLSTNTTCVAIKSLQQSENAPPYMGLFDFSDVNAFLTLAATQHTIRPGSLDEDSRIERIIHAAKAGKVPVHLVSNLSDKNPLEILSEDATIVELLEIFARGGHRVIISSSSSADSAFLGMVTDRALLAHFNEHAKQSAPLHRFLSNRLHSLSLPSLNLRSDVVSCTARDTVLDAMKLMSDQGVSSVAVTEDGAAAGSGLLLSAVSVTDIGKIVVPSQSKHYLTLPLHQFIAQVKEPDGSTDGADKYPVYSVIAANTLKFTIEKILATNTHRVFVTEGSIDASPPPISTLRGVVSVVDILSLFARLANLPDVDPSRMRRSRRESTSSSMSSRSNR